MKKLLLLSLMTVSLLASAQTIETTNQLDDFANYATLYNTHNTKGDIAFAQKIRFNDYTPLQGSSQLRISEITTRLISADSDDSAAIMLVIWDDSLGMPNNKLYETKVIVGNDPNFVDITTSIDSSVLVSDSFFVGYESVADDTIQFYVSQVGCGCDNSYLKESSGNWRTIVDRHSSQDLDLYFRVSFVNDVKPPIASFNYVKSDTFNVQFYNTSLGDIDSVIWDFGNGDSSNDMDPTNIYDGFANYPVCLTVYNSVGSDTYCDTVKIGIAIIFNSIGDVFKRDFGVYPNPFDDLILIVSVNGGSVENARLFDIKGRLIRSYNNIINNTIGTGDISSGMYYLLVNDEVKLIVK